MAFVIEWEGGYAVLQLGIDFIDNESLGSKQQVLVNWFQNKVGYLSLRAAVHVLFYLQKIGSNSIMNEQKVTRNLNFDI